MWGFIIAIIILLTLYSQNRSKEQILYINTYKFPDKVKKSIKEKYPYLKESDMDTVLNSLRKFFIYYNKSKGGVVSMPSQVVDIAWHEFILFTRDYDLFCQKAFGKFLHHTPAEAMKSKTLASDGIKRIWKLACADEKISLSSPKKLPLLFAVDIMLNIKDGFAYSLNCEDKTHQRYEDGYCASHIGCAGGCGDGCGADGGCGGCGGCGG